MSRDSEGAARPPDVQPASLATAPRTDPFDELLRGEWMDPDTGAPANVPIAAIAIELSLRGQEAERVASLGFGRRLAVVSDTVTREVLGARVERALASIARLDAVVLPSDAHADMDSVERVRAASVAADALIAVGSGTINDVVKFAAATDRKPYAVFATAPSMNGYTSANAAITVNGYKKTLPATLASGVFVDLQVLAAAPPRMIRAGLGDSLCRSTAQIDWLLSNRLLGTTYRTAPFALLERDESALLDAPEALLAGDGEAMRALARTLLLSGIGMTLCGGSHPASQGEHLISHYVDMCAPPQRLPSLHGEQVAVATLTMARLQEAMLDAPAPLLHATNADIRMLEGHFGVPLGTACWSEFLPKVLDARRAAALSAQAAARWEALRSDAAAIRIPATRLESVMRRVGAPVAPADIGLDASFYENAVRHARFLRNRFTFLDLADDARVLTGPLL